MQSSRSARVRVKVASPGYLGVSVCPRCVEMVYVVVGGGVGAEAFEVGGAGEADCAREAVPDVDVEAGRLNAKRLLGFSDLKEARRVSS